jgi:hypothetical protein
MHVVRRVVGLAALLSGVFVSGGAAATPIVTLTGPAHAVGDVTFQATTAAPLGSSVAYVELRGIDLAKKPRSTFDHPDVVRTGCFGSPCIFTVGRGAGSRFRFVAFLIDAATHKPIAQSAPLLSVWAPNPVTGISFLINGKRWPLQEVYEAGDDYRPIAPGKLKVEARWAAPLSKGVYITIATSEPTDKQYAACKKGTACRVMLAVPITPQQEMSWQVTVHDRTGAVVDGFQVCLVGKSR